MSAVACRERDQMILKRGKCRVSRHSLLIKLCCCTTTEMLHTISKVARLKMLLRIMVQGMTQVGWQISDVMYMEIAHRHNRKPECKTDLNVVSMCFWARVDTQLQIKLHRLS